MTRNRIMTKLRKRNGEQYTILGVCILLSVLLVSAFAFLYFSPAFQTLLPEGGDTRKLMMLLLSVTVSGCTIFTVYGANLFFKNKSREFGVFLALGERKKNLEIRLVKELGAVLAKYVALGIALAAPLSWVIWKLFSLLLVGAEDLSYRFTPAGIAAGLLFTVFLIGFISLSGARFVKRANIMDILNDQRKTEMVVEIRSWTGRLGLLLVAAGLVLAIAVPAVFVRIFMHSLPAVWNATWLLVLAGLYLIMLSAVGRTHKGKHPQKYYKNIISVNLMRFTAKQTTKNMCVTALLVFVVLASAFWGVMYYNSAYVTGDRATIDNVIHYPAMEKQITGADIEELAKKHGEEITFYEEAQALQLILRFTQRDWSEGQYFDVESERLSSFLSASDFTRISGIPVTVNPGEYLTVVQTGYQRTIWEGPDCIVRIVHPVTARVWEPVYKGTVEFDSMTMLSRPFTFILSDEEYGEARASLDASRMENLVFFNIKEPEAAIHFTRELKNAYIERAGALSDHIAAYDAHEEALAKEAGEDYSYSFPAGLSTDNARLMGDWKYAPFFRALEKEEAMRQVAVYVLLASYISILALSACAVMGYVRSVTIAMDNTKLFEDLTRLGANQAYKKRVIRMQLQKIFAYPVSAGCLIGLLFSLLMTAFNDMRLAAFEIRMLGFQCVLVVFLAGFMYLMYRMSFRRMRQITGVEDKNSRHKICP